jgi:hypothetical protein
MSHKNFLVLEPYIIEAMCAQYRTGASVTDLMTEFRLGRNKITRTLKTALGDEYAACALKAKQAVGQKVAVKLHGRKNPHTPEWNKKISKAHIGFKHSEESKMLIGQRVRERELDPNWQARKAEIYEKIVAVKRANGSYERHSERHSAWMTENAPMRGKKMSDETRMKMSLRKKELIVNGWKPTPFTITDEFRESCRNTAKQSWRNGKFTYGSKKGIMRSKLEIRTYELIKSRYSDAEHTWPIHTEKRSYNYDVFIPSLNTLVEVNGDFWHCNPTLHSEDEWAKVRNVRHIWSNDEEKARVAIEHGYRFITLWETDLTSDTASSFLDQLEIR